MVGKPMSAMERKPLSLAVVSILIFLVLFVLTIFVLRHYMGPTTPQLVAPPSTDDNLIGADQVPAVEARKGREKKNDNEASDEDKNSEEEDSPDYEEVAAEERSDE